MPYRSSSQRRFAHTATAKRRGFPTKEFDKASKGDKDSDLPEHVGDKDDKRFGGKRAAPFTKRKKRPPMYPKDK